ncbi:MAG: hypothetical protein K5663_06395 [Clostridiales bacterium]|nr:hypothetical protein [Clostridiales bacterium]
MKKVITIILLIVVLCLAVNYIGFPWYQIEQADKYMYQGEHSKTEDVLITYINHFFWGKKARARLMDLYTLEAAKSMEAKDYEAAAIAYQKLNDENNAKKAWLALGDTSMSQSDFEKAVKGYSNAGAQSLLSEAYSKWGDQMLSLQNYKDAVRYYQLADDTSKIRTAKLDEAYYLINNNKPSEVIRIVKGYNGKDIAEIVFNAFQCEAQLMQENSEADDTPQELHTKIIALAAKYGESIKDIDTQLAFCNLLKDNGHSLKEVYPDGVEVDYSISNYQVYEPEEIDYSAAYGITTSKVAKSLLDMLKKTNTDNSSSNKILCFSRIENKPIISDNGIEYGKYKNSTTGELENPLAYVDSDRWVATDYYTVKLLPGIMESLNPSLRAKSLSECGKFLIIDKGYMPMGHVTITNTKTYNSNYSSSNKGITSTSYKAYIYYSAYESIALYNKNNPKDRFIFDGYENAAKLADSTINNGDGRSIITAQSIIVNDKNGKSYFGGIEPISGWYNEYYALGIHNEGWLTNSRINKAISSINSKFK